MRFLLGANLFDVCLIEGCVMHVRFFILISRKSSCQLTDNLYLSSFWLEIVVVLNLLKPRDGFSS